MRLRSEDRRDSSLPNRTGRPQSGSRSRPGLGSGWAVQGLRTAPNLVANMQFLLLGRAAWGLLKLFPCYSPEPLPKFP